MSVRPRTSKVRLALIGAGRMGGALLRGWRNDRDAADWEVLVVDPDADARRLAEASGAQAGSQLPPALSDGLDAVVLAVKPQNFEAACAAIGPLPRGVLVISILAGVRIAALQARFAGADVIRAMPNLPAAAGRGVTAYCAAPFTPAAQVALGDRLLACVGETIALEEEGLLDAVTAVSGSGPAYVFLLTEALAEAGAALGLTPAQARMLATSTVAGAGALLAEPHGDPTRLRHAVTSPGGTTEAALEVLDEAGEAGLRALMRRAVKAAAARSEALGES